jgi:23S rRNA pseudouridine1911/1915/1917 synthase
VGGLVALARTGKAAARLSEQPRTHAMGREYLAVAEGCDLPDGGALRDFLRKSGDRVQAVPPGTEGAQEAVLHFAVLERNPALGAALLHIRLETGRKHQIRVQLARAGHPIVQDVRYGHGTPGEPIALWGAVLRLTHPTRKEPMTFLSRPKGKAFLAFSGAVDVFFAEQGGLE